MTAPEKPVKQEEMAALDVDGGPGHSAVTARSAGRYLQQDRAAIAGRRRRGGGRCRRRRGPRRRRRSDR